MDCPIPTSRPIEVQEAWTPSEDRYRNNNKPKEDRLIPAQHNRSAIDRKDLQRAHTTTYRGSHEQTEQEIGAIASTAKIQQHRGSAAGIP
jgi:hypothetical protein